MPMVTLATYVLVHIHVLLIRSICTISFYCLDRFRHRSYRRLGNAWLSIRYQCRQRHV